MIFKIEKKILDWIEEHLFLIAFTGICLLGFGLRSSVRDVVSGDAFGYLLPWYEEISEGFSSLGRQVGNYNMFYQFLICLMTYIPIEPLYAYKLISGIFDFGLAAVVFLWMKKLKYSSWAGLFAFSCVLLSPVVCLNSSAWAQCDSIYTFFAILALLFLAEEKYTWAFVLLGVSFACKLQAIFILPAFLTVYFLKKRFSLLYILLIPISMVVLCIPNILMGRGVREVFFIYSEQASLYPEMYLNYPSFWSLISGPEQYGNLMLMAIFLTIAVLFMMVVYWDIKKLPCAAKDLIDIAFLMSYTCVMFLPAMHERYGYCYEILAVIVAFIRPKTAPLCAAVVAIAGIAYSSFLFEVPVDFHYLGIINFIVYLIYMFLILRPEKVDLPPYHRA